MIDCSSINNIILAKSSPLNLINEKYVLTQKCLNWIITYKVNQEYEFNKISNRNWSLTLEHLKYLLFRQQQQLIIQMFEWKSMIIEKNWMAYWNINCAYSIVFQFTMGLFALIEYRFNGFEWEFRGEDNSYTIYRQLLLF